MHEFREFEIRCRHEELVRNLERHVRHERLATVTDERPDTAEPASETQREDTLPKAG